MKELHRRLYGSQSRQHPTCVRYIVIFRVVMGNQVARSVDGLTHQSKKLRLFQGGTNRSQLRSFPFGDQGSKTPSSVLFTPKDTKFREFVLFDHTQVFAQYLVAYQLHKSHCHCNLPVMERSVVKEGPNKGRKLFICSQPVEESCNYILMEPACLCHKSCEVKISQSARNPGKRYYCCKKKECDFFQWVPMKYDSNKQARTTTTAPRSLFPG